MISSEALRRDGSLSSTTQSIRAAGAGDGGASRTRAMGLTDGDLVVALSPTSGPSKTTKHFLRRSYWWQRDPNAKFLVVGSKDVDYWEKLRPIAESPD